MALSTTQRIYSTIQTLPRYAAVGKHTVVEFRGREASADPLAELLSAGARQLIQQAVEAELQGLLAEQSDRRTESPRVSRRLFS